MLCNYCRYYNASFLTLALTVIFEAFSIDKVKELCSSTDGKKLYANACVLNLQNKLLIAPPIYFVSSYYFSKQYPGIGIELMQIISILFMQSIGYYKIHKWMHQPPNFWIHKFHHEFSTIVTPVVANAVSAHEYCYAYILPLFLAIVLIWPTERAANISIGIVSFSNLLIHFEKAEAHSISLVPRYFVSTFFHLEHHRKRNAHFSAPILNIDAISRKFN